jgi:hypothetical protein
MDTMLLMNEKNMELFKTLNEASQNREDARLDKLIDVIKTVVESKERAAAQEDSSGDRRVYLRANLPAADYSSDGAAARNVRRKNTGIDVHDRDIQRELLEVLKASVINGDGHEGLSVTGFTKPVPMSVIRTTVDKAMNDKGKARQRLKNIENLTQLLRTLFTNECRIHQVKMQPCVAFHRDRATARIAAIEAEYGWSAAGPNVVIQQQQSSSVNVMVNVVTSGGSGGAAGGQAASPSSVAPVVYASSVPTGDARLSPIAPA